MKTMLAIGGFLFLTGCGTDRWDGFVYPNKNDLSSHVSIGEFQTLKACRTSAMNVLLRATYGTPSKGDYECGLNCKSRDGFNVCAETLR